MTIDEAVRVMRGNYLPIPPVTEAWNVIEVELEGLRAERDELREKVERYEYVETCQQAGAVCHDCGRLYGTEYGFPDLIVEDQVWKQISPTNDQYGLLCPSCMVARCEKLGLRDVGARWTSGPFRMRYKPEGQRMTSTERRRELIAILDAVGRACDNGYQLKPLALADRIEALFAETEEAEP